MEQTVLSPRQQQILDLLSEQGEVKITVLRDAFGVTEMTIRRDLEKLEQLGHARRTFGGAIYIDRDVALRDRTDLMQHEKARIGKRAAELIQPGESVFIDAGSTTVQIARYLKPGMGIIVVTNALNVAGELQEKGISTIVTGGNLVDATFSLVGPIAVDTLSKMAFDRVFLGATGCTSRHGFSNSNMHEAEIKRMAISQAGEVNVVLDHDKFGAKVLVSFASLSQVHRIITDRLPEDELLQECRDNGVEVIEC